MAYKKGDKLQTTVRLNARYSPAGKFRATVRVGYPITVTETRTVKGIEHVRSEVYWYATRGTDGKAYVKKRTPKPSGGGSGTAKVKSPAKGYGISTPFGKKPKNSTYWQSRGHHTGDDYAAPYGTDVIAVVDGTIVWRDDKVLGKCMLLRGKDSQGRKRTYWYCHLSNRRVKSGRKVKAGQHIGDVGSTGTGAAMGNHLHFEMRAGHTNSWAGKDLKPAW